MDTASYLRMIGVRGNCYSICTSVVWLEGVVKAVILVCIGCCQEVGGDL